MRCLVRGFFVVVFLLALFCIGTPPASFVAGEVVRDAPSGSDYHVRLTPGGGEIDNPAQGFRADFDTERVRIVPVGTASIWTLELRLAVYGSAARTSSVAPGQLDSRDNRWEVARGPLTEWYVNDSRGLEQGFTLWEPPGASIPPAAAAPDTLFVDVEISGDLVPSPNPDGRSVDLRLPGARFAVLRYEGLKVTDARDRELPARLELLSRSEGFAGGLRIVVETAGAHFPVTIDPLVTTAAWSSAETDNSTDAAWGDWDGDGDLDLAVGNSSAQVNRVYENDGGALVLNLAGGFGWNSTETDDTDAVAWGDWDGDGDLDLAVGNGSQPNRVYENDGLGLSTSLTLVWSSTETDDTTSIAWGDWDGDGDLDLAVGNLDQSNRVYANDGLGSATSLVLTWSSTETETTRGVAWGDLNGDGDLDLAVANDSGTQPNRVYDNDGLGTATSLGPSWASSDVGQTTRAVAWGDVDGDGDLDLAAGNSVRNALYENTGTTLSANPIWTSSEIGVSSNSVAWGDWDGDGDLDLVGGGDAAPFSRNRVWLNQGGALNISSQWQSTELDTTRTAAWGDIDGDGDLDLATGNDGQANRVYENDGGPLATVAAWLSDEIDTAGAPAWGDVDGDGDLDLAVPGVVNRVYENVSGVLETTAGWSSTGISGGAVAWGDWDGDNDLDLAVGAPDSLANRVFENTGSALNAVPVWSSSELDTTRTVAWGDWDGDGDLDLAVGNSPMANPREPVRVYANDGLGQPGSLSLVWSSVELIDVTDIAWGDWDDDGDLDLAVSQVFGTDAAVYANDGLGLPTSMTRTWESSETGNIGEGVAWGDWDGDGDLDLALGTDTARVYANDGLGLSTSLVLAWSSTAGASATGVAWQDWDGDGDLDLAAGGSETRVYENTGGDLTVDPVWSASEAGVSYSAAWGDMDGDGDPDLASVMAFLEPSRLYENGGVSRPGNLPETPAHPVTLRRPGSTASAFFFSAAELVTPPVAIQYTLFDEQSDRAWQIVPEYSPNGGGQWFPATESDSDGTTNLAADPSGTPHIFIWDAAADGAYSDNVVFRITLTAQAPDHAGYPLHRGALSSVTPPFRVAVDTDGDHVADVLDNCPSIPNPSQVLSSIGDRAWIDTNGNGIQDGGEPGFANLPVVLYDGSLNLLEIGSANPAGNYLFPDLCPGDYVVGFFLPVGYSFSPPDQDPDGGADSDADPVTGLTGVIALTENSTRPEFDAGLVPGCLGPDEPVYISEMARTSDGNNYPILTFMDPNQPSEVTGYNVYRTDDPSLPMGSWPLVAGNIVDMDEATPNNQWIDTSGDEPVAGPAWFYQVTAYSSVCNAEGPF